MAWEKTHRLEIKGLKRQQLWSVWEDVNQWHLWDTDIEFAKLSGHFAVGETFDLKPKKGPKVKIKILSVVPQTAFTDVTSFPLARMYGIHEMRDIPGGLEIIHTVRIEGPLSFLWQKIVAENVAAGIEEQAAKMIARAQKVKLNDQETQKKQPVP